MGELIGPQRHVVVGPSPVELVETKLVEIEPVETAQLILDEATVESAVAAVGAVGLIVSLGSGTITDLGKVVSARSGAPLIAVQTAASVNGFSDPLSVLVIGGEAHEAVCVAGGVGDRRPPDRCGAGAAQSVGGW